MLSTRLISLKTRKIRMGLSKYKSPEEGITAMAMTMKSNKHHGSVQYFLPLAKIIKQVSMTKITNKQ